MPDQPSSAAPRARESCHGPEADGASARTSGQPACAPGSDASSSPEETLRGPIRVSPDGRHFVDADGRPFFWLGDTAWPLLTSYTRDDATTYLADRGSRGFTVIQTVAAWGDPKPPDLTGRAPGPNYRGELPWTATPAKPNPAFFEHVDFLLDYAAEQSLVLAILPTWGHHVSDEPLFTEDTAYAYAHWLGERYRDRANLIWVDGGDREPLGHEAVYRALARGLRDGDGGAHLITYHPCGWHSSSYYFHDEDWLDFNMIQTWGGWPLIYPSVAADRQLLPVKPVVLAEPAYEDGPEYPQGPITPLIVRRQAWWAFMAGGSFTYGQNQMWRMEPGWLSALDTPGARSMTQFRAIATSRPWWKMIPDQGLFSSGVGSERTLNAALRAVDRSCAMLYLSGPCHVVINIDRIATRQARATWVNPATGERQDAGTFATGNATGATFPEWKTACFTTPNFWEDAVLLLDGVD